MLNVAAIEERRKVEINALRSQLAQGEQKTTQAAAFAFNGNCQMLSSGENLVYQPRQDVPWAKLYEDASALRIHTLYLVDKLDGAQKMSRQLFAQGSGIRRVRARGDVGVNWYQRAVPTAVVDGV